MILKNYNNNKKICEDTEFKTLIMIIICKSKNIDGEFNLINMINVFHNSLNELPSVVVHLNNDLVFRLIFFI